MKVLEESIKIKTNFEFLNLSKTGENALKISYSHVSSKQREVFRITTNLTNP